MTRFEIMTAAARQAMIHVLDLQPENQVLVVTDKVTRTCGDAFARGAERHGCPVDTYVISEAERPLKSVPEDLVQCLADADVVINAIAGDDREVPFRIEWIQAIEAKGTIRLGHSPGIDEDMMVGGPLDVDYGDMIDQASHLIEAFKGAESVQITAPGGTDLRLDLTGRWFITDVKATVNEGSNLPCGEVYCCPVETGADGVLVVDGCFGGYGNVPTPVKITIRNGRVIDVSAEDEEVVEVVNGLLDTDDGSRTIAELGIGLNPGARLTPRMLEAEKAGGTAHIAFGSNEGMPGGKSISKMHTDYLFLKPTMKVTFSDGSRKVLLKNGAIA
ncbi:MAG: aminopeptidase [Gemmatimonadales bacterium]|nr:aminopeptidase [Gemmatimonadales bacterium]